MATILARVGSVSPCRYGLTNCFNVVSHALLISADFLRISMVLTRTEKYPDFEESAR